MTPPNILPNISPNIEPTIFRLTTEYAEMHVNTWNANAGLLGQVKTWNGLVAGFLAWLENYSRGDEIVTIRAETYSGMVTDILEVKRVSLSTF